MRNVVRFHDKKVCPLALSLVGPSRKKRFTLLYKYIVQVTSLCKNPTYIPKLNLGAMINFREKG